MEKQAHHCPNCSAPLSLEPGQVEVLCEFCESRLKFIPGEEELEVFRKREEMKYRERVAVRKLVLEKELQKEEGERWRQTAAKVAITALPVVGSAMGRQLFNAALGRRSGCLGCGCLIFAAGAVLLLLGLLL